MVVDGERVEDSVSCRLVRRRSRSQLRYVLRRQAAYEARVLCT